METRGVSASKGFFEKDDQQPQMSPVVSASPHSYRSGGRCELFFKIILSLVVPYLIIIHKFYF